MNAEADKRIKVREGAVAWQEVDGEAILLDLANSTYLGLNGSATILWPEIAKGTDRDALVALLRERYGITEEKAAADVDEFLATCTERNLLEP
jgi:hypothetical protein